MKIGIISDTHNEIEMVRKAVAIFREKDVDIVLHAGDLTSPRIIDMFKEFPCRFVLGNGDIDVEIITEKSKACGFGCVEAFCDFMAGTKRVLVLHGNDVPMFRRFLTSGEYDYIIKGHTHIFENYVSHRTRIINPGSLYGGEENTIAILDTQADRVEKIRIERE